MSNNEKISKRKSTRPINFEMATKTAKFFKGEQNILDASHIELAYLASLLNGEGGIEISG